jgi:hypothetical protein
MKNSTYKIYKEFLEILEGLEDSNELRIRQGIITTFGVDKGREIIKQRIKQKNEIKNFKGV